MRPHWPQKLSQSDQKEQHRNELLLLLNKLAQSFERVPSFSEVHKKHKTLTLLLEYIFSLLPVLIISLIVTSLAQKISEMSLFQMKGIHFFSLGALCVPWITQLSSFPLYSIVGNELYKNRDRTSVEKIILKNIFTLWLKSIFFIIPLTFVAKFLLEWRWQLTLLFSSYLSLHSLFALFMVYGIVEKKWSAKIPWFVSWLIYGISLLVFPKLILLPPVLSSAFMCIFLLIKNGNWEKLEWQNDVYTKMFTGLLVGLIFWIDKLVFFVLNLKNTVYADEFSYELVFISLIPSVLALSYYYIYRSPALEDKLRRMVQSMERGTISDFFTEKEEIKKFLFSTWFDVLVINSGLAFVFSGVYFYKIGQGSHGVFFHFFLPVVLTCIIVVINSLMMLKQNKLVRNLGLFYLFSFFIVLYSLTELKHFLFKFGTIHFYELWTFFSVMFYFLLIWICKRKWEIPHIIVLRGES